MDDSNQPSLNLNTNSFPLLNGVAGGVENRPLLHSTSTPTHSYIRFTLSIYSPPPIPSWPCWLLCNNEFSINRFGQDQCVNLVQDRSKVRLDTSKWSFLPPIKTIGSFIISQRIFCRDLRASPQTCAFQVIFLTRFSAFVIRVALNDFNTKARASAHG